jgi:hypothetical protein
MQLLILKKHGLLLFVHIYGNGENVLSAENSENVKNAEKLVAISCSLQ